jgi:hypothetical protein
VCSSDLVEEQGIEKLINDAKENITKLLKSKYEEIAQKHSLSRGLSDIPVFNNEDDIPPKIRHLLNLRVAELEKLNEEERLILRYNEDHEIENLLNSPEQLNQLANFNWSDVKFGEDLGKEITKYTSLVTFQEGPQLPSTDDHINDNITPGYEDNKQQNNPEIIPSDRDIEQIKDGNIRGIPNESILSIAGTSAGALAITALLGYTIKRLATKGRNLRFAGTRFVLGEKNTLTARKLAHVYNKIDKISDKIEDLKIKKEKTSKKTLQDLYSRKINKLMNGDKLKRLEANKKQLMNNIYYTVIGNPDLSIKKYRSLRSYTRRAIISQLALNKQYFDKDKGHDASSNVTLLKGLNKIAKAEIARAKGHENRARNLEKEAKIHLSNFNQKTGYRGNPYYGMHNIVKLDGAEYPIFQFRYIDCDNLASDRYTEKLSTNLKTFFNAISKTSPFLQRKTYKATINYDILENGRVTTKTLSCSFDDPEAYELTKALLIRSIPNNGNIKKVTLYEETRTSRRSDNSYQEYNLTNAEQRRKFEKIHREPSIAKTNKFRTWWNKGKDGPLVIEPATTTLDNTNNNIVPPITIRSNERSHNQDGNGRGL